MKSTSTTLKTENMSQITALLQASREQDEHSLERIFGSNIIEDDVNAVDSSGRVSRKWKLII